MSTLTDVAVVEHYVAGFNAGDMEAIASCFLPHARIHGVLDGSLQSALFAWKDLHRAFGVNLSIEAVCASNATVAVRYKERGVFRDEFHGFVPTGRPYDIVAMHWFEFEHGRIARRWGVRDTASIARQAGLDFSTALNEERA